MVERIAASSVYEENVYLLTLRAQRATLGSCVRSRPFTTANTTQLECQTM